MFAPEYFPTTKNQIVQEEDEKTVIRRKDERVRRLRREADYKDGGQSSTWSVALWSNKSLTNK